MIKRVLVAGVLGLLPQLALAERPPQYWGVSLGTFELNDANDNITETTNIGLQAGYKFFSFFGAALRGGWQGTRAEGVLDSPSITYGGAFARFDLPYERVNVYILVGGGGVRYDTRSGTTESYSGPAGGVGIELYGSEKSALSLEYMNYTSDETRYDGVSIGFVHHFNWVTPGG